MRRDEHECGVLEIDRILSVLQRRCDSLGVTLKWSSTAPTASTDGKHITIPMLKRPVTREAMLKLYGFVVHESGHHTRMDAFKILHSAKPKRALASLFNIVEDDGMEREVASKWAGDARALGEGNNVIIKEVAASWEDQIALFQDMQEALPDGAEPHKITELDMAPVAACALGQLARVEWDGYSNGGRAVYMNALHPIAKTLLDELVKEGWVAKFKATDTPHDTWDVACDLHKRLFPNGEEKIEKLRTLGHDMNELAPPKEPDEVIEGTAKAKDKEPEDGVVISWKDAVLSDHEWTQKPDDVTPGNVGIDWTDYRSSKENVVLMPPNLINVMDMRTDQYEVEPEGGRPNRTGRAKRHTGAPSTFLSDNKQARQFANQIRRYIQATQRTRIKTEQYTGKLDQRGIVKLAMPPINGGDWNKRIFYGFDKARALNTCIHVLTDWSGSMQGIKMKHAADASGRLVHTFDRVLHIPVQLAAFSNSRTRCDIGLMKSFSDRSVSPMDIAESFSRFYKFSSANNDADAVMWAYRELMKRKEERKILIVLSDGCPAGAWGGGSSSDNLKYVTDHIQKDGSVELYGVGIKSTAVATYYKNNRVIQEVEDINNVLFTIIKEGVHQ